MPLTITSTFKPMTYDELARPVIEQTAAHLELETMYSDLTDKANQLEALANQQTDRIAYLQLKTYVDDLRAQADQLLRTGLQRSSRMNLLNMKRRYSKEVTPVELAIARRGALAEEQRQLSIKDPDMLYERNAKNMSLDTFLKDPMADYGSSYSGVTITKRVADAVKAVAEGIVSVRTDGHLTPYQIKVLTTNGFDPYEIENTIKGGGNENDLLVSIRDRVLDSIDVYHNGDQETKNKALNYANEGLLYGAQKANISLTPDPEAAAALDWFYKELEKREAELFATEGAGAAIVPQNIYSKEEVEIREDNIQNFLKYFDRQLDGTYRLNEEGKKEYEKKDKIELESESRISLRIRGPVGQVEKPNFYNFIKSLGVDTDSEDAINSAFSQYMSPQYDASKLTEYAYPIDPSEQTVWNQRVAEHANGILYEADWNSQTKNWQRGSSVAIGEALENDGNVSSVQYSAYGLTIKITDKKGKSTRYILPSGINPRNETNLKSQLLGLQRALDLYNSMGSNSKIATPLNIKLGLLAIGYDSYNIPDYISKADLEYLIKQMLSAAIKYMAYFGGTNSVSDQKFKFRSY